MGLTPPKAILFDWDNTLVDTWPIIYQALHDTMVAWSMEPWSLEEVKLKVGKSLRDAFPELFAEDWERAGEYYMQRYRSYNLERLEALPDVLPVLEHVQQSHPFIGVVSNKRGDNLRTEVGHIGWEPYFDVLVGAGDATRDKPHPDPALLALDGTDISAGEDVWFVGDTITDLECAQAAGMTAILYGDVPVDSDNLYRGFPFAHHTRNHTELLALLRGYT